MDREIKARWVAALRSGEYEQGHASLRVGDAFCCLGVLCDIAVRDGVIGEPTIDEGEYAYGRLMERGVLPTEVEVWSGLHIGDPVVVTDTSEDYPLEENLSSLNDEGMSFEEIAEFIEDQL